MTSKWILFAAVAFGAFLSGCDEKKEPLPVSDAPALTAPQPPSIDGDITYQVFPVNDSTGRPAGWGYDLYVNGKRTIHQAIIPAVPGNSAFHTEEDARKIAGLAAGRMKKSGSLPTITPEDLDSLHIAR